MCTHLCRWIWEKKCIIHRLSVFRRTHHRDITDTLEKNSYSSNCKVTIHKIFCFFFTVVVTLQCCGAQPRKDFQGTGKGIPGWVTAPCSCSNKWGRGVDKPPNQCCSPPQQGSDLQHQSRSRQADAGSYQKLFSHIISRKTKKHPVSKLYKRHYCRKEITFTLCIIRFSQASRGSLTSPSCTSSMRQATPAPVRGKRLDGRTAVTSRSSGISRGSATPAKTRSAVSSQCPHRANHEDCWDCTGY